MTAVAYIRVSTDAQAREGVSLDAQRAKIEAWCSVNEHHLDQADVFVEGADEDAGEGKRKRGKSGGRADNRPALQAAIERVCKLKGVLVFYSLSRLARSTRDTLTIAERLDRAGADMVSLSEKIDTTSASGKMVFRLLAVLAEFERDLIKERTSLALQHKISRGERCGKVRFGSALDPADPKRLVALEAEGQVVEQIRAWKDHGQSLRWIAAELDRRGVPTKEGRPAWHHSTVARILKRGA